jgi:hypothetical protein
MLGLGIRNRTRRPRELILPSNQSTLQQVSMTLAGMTSGYIDWGDGNVTNITTH